jgi:hypothetical protein
MWCWRRCDGFLMRREPKSAGEDFIRRQADLGNKSTAH